MIALPIEALDDELELDELETLELELELLLETELELDELLVLELELDAADETELLDELELGAGLLLPPLWHPAKIKAQ